MENSWIIRAYVPKKKSKMIILKIIGIICLISALILIPFLIKKIILILVVIPCLLIAYGLLINKKIKFDENGIWLMRKKYVAWKDVYNFTNDDNILSMTLKSPKDGKTITVNAGVAGKKHIEKIPAIFELYNAKKEDNHENNFNINRI